MDETKKPEVSIDPMTCPTIPCRCGRQARVHPETGKPFNHRPGVRHPSAPKKRVERKSMWCPDCA